jgi:hypothetical protein
MATLHHLVCWNPDYVEKAVEKHLAVVHGPTYGSDSDGSVWWGKFRVPLDEDGNPGEEYEPYGESKSGEDAAREVEEFKNRIRSGQEVRLYIHNPNPPMTECHVARVVDIHYGESATIPKDSQGRPACARIPDYYFHHRRPGVAKDVGPWIRNAGSGTSADFGTSWTPSSRTPTGSFTRASWTPKPGPSSISP